MKVRTRLLAMMLAIVMIISILPVGALAGNGKGNGGGHGYGHDKELPAEGVSTNSVVVIAGSDFQDPGDKDANASASSNNVKSILNQIKIDYATADALIFCGDYDKDLPSADVQKSTTALKNAVNSVFSDVDDFFLVQGNHDQVTQGTNGLTGPGAHDTTDYGVFIIDEDDYQWSSGVNENRIKATAASLKSYLNGKISAGYTKPIFVASHVPLHFSPRTQEGDGKYAKYIFDELQAGGEAGLTIIFLYGHDHSQGWDNYMGGAAVYLPKGHDINIANVGSGTVYGTYTLNFNYMNAGFVGYYADWEPETDYKNKDSGVDKTKTMSVFEITDSEVTVKRYDENGVHVLKSEGKENVKHTTRTQCPLMTDVLTSPQTISLTSVPPVNPPETDDTVYTGNYEYAASAEAGKEYLLVSNGYALQNDNGVVSAAKVKVNDDGTLSVDETASEASLLWEFNESSFDASGDFTVSNDGLYVGRESGDAEQAMELLESNSTYYTTWSYVDGSALRQVSGSSSDYVFYTYARNGSFYVNHSEDIDEAGYDYTLKLYEKAAEPEEPTAEKFTDDATGIKVTTTSGTGLTVETLGNDDLYESRFEKYARFDISVADFEPGTEATVSIPVPADYDVSKTAAYYRNGDALTNMNATVENGYATFTTTHFTEYSIGEGKTVDITTWVPVEIPGETTYTYTLDTDGINSGSKYIIVGGGNNNYVMTTTGSTGSGNGQSVTISNNTITLDTNAYEWEVGTTSLYNYNWTTVTADSFSSNKYTLSNPDNYYYLNDNGYHQVVSAVCTRTNWYGRYSYSWTITYRNNNGGTNSTTVSGQSITLYQQQTNTGYTFKQGSNYMYFDGSSSTPAAIRTRTTAYGWAVTLDNNQYRIGGPGTNRTIRYSNGFGIGNRDGNRVRLFKLTNTNTTPGQNYYLGLVSETPYSFPTSRFANRTALETYLKEQIKVVKADDTNGTNAQFVVDYTLSRNGTVDPTTAGTATYTVSYDGHTVGTVEVNFKDKSLTGITLKNDNEGTVYRGAKKNALTNSFIIAAYDDGTTEEIPIKVNMISGDFDVETEGTYTGLTVTYGNQSVSGYTLHVIANPNMNDYPEYPHEGSVRVNKTGSPIDWLSTGVAKVELSATGVPMQKGVDVIIMLDTSSSMNDAIGSTTRIAVLRQSLKNMLKTFSTPDATTGMQPDIRVAVADFNGYTNSSTSPYKFDSNDICMDGAAREANTYDSQVYTGNKSWTAEAFDKASEYADETARTDFVNKIKIYSGTNYDAAFYNTYQLGQAITAANEAAGEDRDLYVVFMSDGAPFQYNGFSSMSEKSSWNTWLQGIVNNAATGTHSYFYNGTGNKHRWAEAIKGSSAKLFTVIDKTKNTTGDNAYLTQVKGLEATMYSIGFCLAVDKQITVESMEHVLKNIATNETYYHKADTAADLNNAFTQIASSIRKAGYNAAFVDTMGADYDLQMASKVGSEASDGGVVVTLADHGITPTIEVKEYDIYKKSDVGTNDVTAAMVGQRKGTYNTLETVTFNADGSEAYSDKIGGVEENILSNGVICAKTFYYNTTSVEVTVDDIKIAPETFYWKIGTIGEKEIALSYYVYLTGSMEGTRPAGNYPTNKNATLYYTNWLDHEAHKDTVSPVLPWGAANVSYAFYLVDKDGEVIVNQSTGETGSFANKVAVTTPVTQQILLNNEQQLQAIELYAGNVLPEGYTLYDDCAAYKIAVYSGEGSYWDITNTKVKYTTYVTGYAADQYTTEDHNGNDVDYTHTTVWFAVMFEVGCVPDVVVIDYGLPVEINVLANDMFGNYGTLNALAKLDGKTLPSGVTIGLLEGFDFDKSAVGEFGTAEIANGKIKYQIDKENTQMKMDDLEVFAYAVRYFTDIEELEAYNGNYYSTVTVIPATIIYYEDDFVKFENADGRAESSLSGVWNDAGTRDSDATQAEDRPGYYSLSDIDANNLYGFDGAYQNYATYSNGSAKKVTLISGNGDNPTATFEFTGSAFDIISVTSGDTGTILVDVYKANENGGFDETYDYEWIVDTYYGYTYELTGTYEKLTWKYDGSAWHVESEEVDDLGENQEFPENPTEGNQVIRYREIGKWVKTGRGALYQIPVIKSPDLGYGTYKVVVRPSYGKFFDHTGKGQYDFYFDAVRVYNPADNGSKNSTIEKAYKDDNEAYPQYIEVRNNLIGQGYFNNDNEEQGFVFIDGFGATNDIANYTNYGPNNEVYLQNGQAVAFKLKAENGADNVASVQLSTKCVNGPTELTVINGSVTRSIKLNTSTDLYYDITSIVKWDEENDTSDEIILLNTSSNLVSITNVKITYKEEPSEPAKVFMTSASASKAVTLLRTMYIAANTAEPEEPFVVEPEVFEPAKVSVKVTGKNFKVGDTISATITTSSDVASLTLNGIAAKLKKTDKKTGEKTWTVSVKASAVGDMILSVVAYDSEGVASDPIQSTITVKAKNGNGKKAKP